jgi:hypothetical protein
MKAKYSQRKRKVGGPKQSYCDLSQNAQKITWNWSYQQRTLFYHSNSIFD